MADAINIHASAISVDGVGFVMVGPSGSGKSALAFDCLSEAKLLGLPAALISDDRLLVSRDGSTVTGRAPETIRGLIELRYGGIVTVDTVEAAALHFAVTLASADETQRLPPENEQHLLAEHMALPLLRVPAWTRFPLSLMITLSRQSVVSSQ